MKRYHIAMLLILTACSGNQITVTDDPITDDPSDDGGITVVDGTIGIVFSENGATVTGDELGLVSGDGSLTVTAVGKAGITSDDYIRITENPTITVSSKTGHGIRGKEKVLIEGGTVKVSTAGNIRATSSDDAINSGSDMTITGGNIHSFSSGNDGLDANGNMYVKGGYIYAVGSGSPEVALDANTEGGYKLYLSGGSLVAFGGIESGSSITQAVVNVTSWTANASYALYNGDTLLLEFTAPSKGGNGIVLSHPDLVSGSSYTLKTGSTSQSIEAAMSSSGSTGGGLGSGGFPGGGGHGWH